MQAVELPATNSNAPEKTKPNAEEQVAAETEIVPNNVDSADKMDVDIPAESTVSESNTQPQPESVPDVPKPVSSQAEESLLIADEAKEALPIANEAKDLATVVIEPEKSLPSASQTEQSPKSSQIEIVPPKAAEVSDVLEIDDTPIAVADTTTPPAIEIDSEPTVSEPALTQSHSIVSASESEPIALDSSPSDADSKDEAIVISSQAVTESAVESVVDLDQSSNEGDLKIEAANTTQRLDSLDLEIINSDSSSNSVNEVQIESSSAIDLSEEQAALPTSTQVTITEIIDTPADKNSNDILEVQSSESAQNLIESPDKLRTIAGETRFVKSK